MLYQLSYFPENGKQYTIAFSRKQAEKSGNCKIRRVDPMGPESRRGAPDARRFGRRMHAENRWQPVSGFRHGGHPAANRGKMERATGIEPV